MMLLRCGPSDIEAALHSLAKGETPTIVARVPRGEVVPFPLESVADYVLEHWLQPPMAGKALMFAKSLRAVAREQEPHIPIESVAHHVLLYWKPPAFKN